MIQVENLTKTFDQFTAVKDISFQVDAGEIFAFLGPNGAGKTTTIKMLTTLLRPTAGHIHLDGFDPGYGSAKLASVSASSSRIRASTASRPLTKTWSCTESCTTFPTRARERIEQLLRLFELWERRGDYVKTFSGGMKRRLEIARGFLHTPKILFLDEPTLGLDPQSRNQLWTHVKALNEKENTTVFLTTHYMDEADRVAHRIAVMDHGAIVAIGTSAELKARTNTDSLEGAFLALTGTSLRDEAASSTDAMRRFAQMWQQKR